MRHTRNISYEDVFHCIPTQVGGRGPPQVRGLTPKGHLNPHPPSVPFTRGGGSIANGDSTPPPPGIHPQPPPLFQTFVHRTRPSEILCGLRLLWSTASSPQEQMCHPLLASIGCSSSGYLKRCPSKQQPVRATPRSCSSRPKSAVIERCRGRSMGADGLGSVSSRPMPSPAASPKVSCWFGEQFGQ